MATQEIFLSLQLNLYKPLIFFIPKGDVPDYLRDFLKSMGIEIVFNKVIFIENEGSGYLLEQKPKLYQILLKYSLLDKNMFSLIDYKEKLKPDQFNHLLLKYTEQVNLSVNISVWMRENMSKYIPNVAEAVKVYFSTQQETLLAHQKTLLDAFLFKNKPSFVNTVLLKQFKEDMQTLMLHKSSVDQHNVKQTNSNDNQPIQQPVIKEQSKKRKPVLISKEEADIFLLKTVFGVKL